MQAGFARKEERLPMKKILTLLILLMTLCAAAAAEDMHIDLTGQTTDAPRGYVTIRKGVVTIAGPGTYRITGAMEGRIVVEAKKDAEITLVLDGAEVACADYAPLYLKKAGEVRIVLAAGSDNKLTNGGRFDDLDDNNVDAALFAKCDVTIAGEGALTIASGDNGLTGKDNVAIEGGTLTITAAGHALEAKESITVTGGTLTLTAEKDAIHTENDADLTQGVFVMEGGSVQISCGDDAVHAVASLTVKGGTLDVLRCAEGIEADVVAIAGGEVTIRAAGDAIHAETASGEEDGLIRIDGGTLTILTQGDALDARGDIRMTGGTVVIHGPGDADDGLRALDHSGSAIIDGGCFVAITAPGKAFGDESAQPSCTVNASRFLPAGTTVAICDGAGNVCWTGAAEMAFSSVIVSLPEMTVGGSCTVTMGETEIAVSQTGVVTLVNVR